MLLVNIGNKLVLILATLWQSQIRIAWPGVIKWPPPPMTLTLSMDCPLLIINCMIRWCTLFYCMYNLFRFMACMAHNFKSCPWKCIDILNLIIIHHLQIFIFQVLHKHFKYLHRSWAISGLDWKPVWFVTPCVDLLPPA